MDVDLRRLVRVFLVVGGIAYVGWGVLTSDLLRIGLGVFALAVGAAGLYRGMQPSSADAG